MEELVLQAKDGLGLSVAVAEVENPRALVQLIHGAVEHKERYYNFMKYLNDNGFAAIISDNRGHGKSVNKEFPLGYMDGYEQMIEDQMEVTRQIKARYPGKELYLFGHSFGSLLARCYLQKHDDEIRKLVLSGTVNYIGAVPVGMAVGRVITGITGRHGVNRLLNSMGMNGKDDTWVSANEENLRAYRKDPLCQYPYANSAIMTIFESDRSLHQYEKYQCKNPNLPILSVTGIDDPVTGGTKGLEDTVRYLRRIGYHDITSKVYQGMKHEVLNECDHMTVYRDVADFLKNNSHGAMRRGIAYSKRKLKGNNL